MKFEFLDKRVFLGPRHSGECIGIIRVERRAIMAESPN